MSVPTISGIAVSPASPYLNQDYKVNCDFAVDPDFAVCKIDTEYREITSSSCVFRAGFTPVGTHTISIYAHDSEDSDSDTSQTVTIRDSDMRDLVASIARLLEDELGSQFSTVRITTKSYNSDIRSPQVVVGRLGKPDEIRRIPDNQRRHNESFFIDTFFIAPFEGDTSVKLSRYNLDCEIKRIINAYKSNPWEGVHRMQITSRIPFDDISDEKKIFKSRHYLTITWFEDLT